MNRSVPLDRVCGGGGQPELEFLAAPGDAERLERIDAAAETQLGVPARAQLCQHLACGDGFRPLAVS